MFIRSVQRRDDLDAFRQEVRDFCRTEMPPEVRRKQGRGEHLERDEYDAWMKCLGSKGWLTGKWPKEHGGLGWEPERFLVFEEELGRASAPPIITFGTALAGPVIYSFGTSEQRLAYLGDIARNRTWWCQGYSEPGAGSDLASLKTRAVRDGDHYIVNGQKIWTSYAHWADMMFALVRTNPDVKKQEGISFLLIDMKTPGITVRPIIGITLDHHLNEVFLENVRVPVANLIGEENKGWTYAKFVLANERILKLRGTELQQAILQTGVDILGRHGLAYQSDALHTGWNGDLIGPQESPGLIYEHLYRRAASVYSGSSEVQRNILAKGVLGL
jgi:alkylation response protein AidB-like acyl-CoA dehydrogenase